MRHCRSTSPTAATTAIPNPALAALRNEVLTLLRAHGHQAIAETLWSYAAHLLQAFQLLLQPRL